MDWFWLWAGLICAAAGGGVLWLAAWKRLVPEPYARWVMLAGGVLATAGVSLLVGAFRARRPATQPPAPAPPPVVVVNTPTPGEVKALDERALTTDEKIRAIEEKHSEVADEGKTEGNPGAGGGHDMDVGDFLAARADALRDQPE